MQLLANFISPWGPGFHAVPLISAPMSLLTHPCVTKFFSSYSLPALEIRSELDTVVTWLEIRKVSANPAVAAMPF